MLAIRALMLTIYHVALTILLGLSMIGVFIASLFYASYVHILLMPSTLYFPGLEPFLSTVGYFICVAIGTSGVVFVFGPIYVLLDIRDSLRPKTTNS